MRTLARLGTILSALLCWFFSISGAFLIYLGSTNLEEIGYLFVLGILVTGFSLVGLSTVLYHAGKCRVFE